MMYVIYNNDGSIKYKLLNEFVEQGNNNVNELFVAIEGRENWTLYASFKLPNGSTTTVVSSTPTTEFIEGLGTFTGRKILLSNAETLVAGALQMNVVCLDENDAKLVAFNTYITVNETGIQLSDPILLTVQEYENLLAELKRKMEYPVKYVQVTELPDNPSLDTIYVLKGEDDLNEVFMYNGKTESWIPLGSNRINLGLYYTKTEGEQFEESINAELENYQEEINGRVSNVESQVQSVASGSPKGVYDTLSDLETAYPTGTSGIYVVLADGHWYYWNASDSAWTDGGVYLSQNADNYLSKTSINPVQNKVVTDHIDDLEKKTFKEYAYGLSNDNIFEDSNFVLGEYSVSQNSITFEASTNRLVSKQILGGSSDIILNNEEVISCVVEPGYGYCLLAYYDDGNTYRIIDSEITPYQFFYENKKIKLPKLPTYQTRLCVMLRRVDNANMTTSEASNFKCVIGEYAEDFKPLDERIEDVKEDVEVLSDKIEKPAFDFDFYAYGYSSDPDGQGGYNLSLGAGENQIRKVSCVNFLANAIKVQSGQKVHCSIASGYKYSFVFYKQYANSSTSAKIEQLLSFETTDLDFTANGDFVYIAVMVGKTDNSNISAQEAKAAFSCKLIGLEDRIEALEERVDYIKNGNVLNGKLMLPDTYELPFDVIKTEKGYYPNVSIKQLNNNPLKVYINVSSTDTGLGTSEANPITLERFRENLTNSLYNSQNIELVFIDKVNLYSSRSNFELISSTDSNVKNLTISAKQKGTWIGIGIAPTWEVTETEGIYEFTSATKISDLCDLENINKLGMPNCYVKVANLSSVIATAGTFCQNSSNVVYVHPYANNDVSKIVALYGLDYSASNLGVITIKKTTAGNVVFKDLGFLMDTLNVRYGQTLTNNFWFFDCKFHRGSQDAIGIDGLYNAYFVDCVADYASKDNFNYHGTNKDIIVAEFNSISYGAGKYKLDTVGHNITTDSNNGSTAHNGMTIMRFGCSYWECEGAIIADVNNCKTLNVDCVAKKVLSSITNPNYNALFMLHDNRNAGTIYRNDTHTNYLINCGGLGATYKCDIEGMEVIASNFVSNIENNYMSGGSFTEQDMYI